MPLSDHEQRVLDELERQLYADDPSLASQLSTPRGPAPVRRIVLGAAMMLAGLAVVLVGVSTHLVVVGVLGAVLLGGGILVLTSRRASASRAPGAPAAGDGGPHAGRRRGGLMDRLDREWDSRGRADT